MPLLGGRWLLLAWRKYCTVDADPSIVQRKDLHEVLGRGKRAHNLVKKVRWSVVPMGLGRPFDVAPDLRCQRHRKRAGSVRRLRHPCDHVFAIEIAVRMRNDRRSGVVIDLWSAVPRAEFQSLRCDRERRTMREIISSRRSSDDLQNDEPHSPLPLTPTARFALIL